ncbi:hypothetical protein JTE90_023367 [Oedothorax gibbosus]|uniref:Uncharacterized protein n=1 Tax=Oedothorax gibbosus TaxID=931172 RepID=A0AAV6V237_9ARAC|nr:hypothetical protein JTE90_023367 [Oedothorax gibbosus]
MRVFPISGKTGYWNTGFPGSREKPDIGIRDFPDFGKTGKNREFPLRGGFSRSREKPDIGIRDFPDLGKKRKKRGFPLEVGFPDLGKNRILEYGITPISGKTGYWNTGFSQSREKPDIGIRDSPVFRIIGFSLLSLLISSF